LLWKIWNLINAVFYRLNKKMIIGLEATRANKKFRTGTEWYAWHLLQQFKKIDQTNRFIVYYNKPLAGDLRAAPDNFYFKRLNWPFKKFWTHFRLGLELIIHPINKFFASNAVPFLSRGEIIVTICDLGFLRYPKLYHPLERIYQVLTHRLAVAKAKKIITISEATKNDILKYWPQAKNKIKVIPLGFDQENFKVLNSEEKKYFKDKMELPSHYLLYVGRLETKKNIQNLIRAYKNSSRQWPLVLAGRPGNFGYEEIVELANDPAVKDDIIMLGYVSQKNYEKLIASAEAFVFPSNFEGFGLPLLEAMASGTPVVCSNLPVLKEVAKEAALFFDPHKVDDIKDKLNQIMANSHLRQILIYKGLARAKLFSWEKCARATLDYILE
jgi:glycosyltransferase involved in cell wall biosynthesis